MSAVLDGEDGVGDARRALVGNILAQDAAVDVSFTILNEATEEAATDYRSTLRDMRDAVDQVDGVVSMGPFWQAAADLL